jgi:hypothetical protein
METKDLGQYVAGKERNVKNIFVVILSLFAFMCAWQVNAATLKITSYDVVDTPESGFGCWSHNYIGTIIDSGKTVSGSVNCGASSPGPAHVLNYSNGNGTLNDGLFDTGPTQLLMTRFDDLGNPLHPAITIYFDQPSQISSIKLLKGGNSFTGISGVTVEINGVQVPIIPTQIGGESLSVLLVLTGTGLELKATSKITLKNFSATFVGFPIDQFGIGEIVVDGNAVLYPSDKAQCKDAGWMSFGFENEGQCIKFVNHR